MRELTSHRFIHAKAVLFLVLGILSAGAIVLSRPTLHVVALLVVTVWAFARLYFYAFYVLEHFVDPTFRYAGLISALRHLVRQARVSSRS
jgi:hypothetical protein